MPVLMASRMNENGLSAQFKAWIAGAMMIEVRSAWRAATVFGMVSPKTSRTVVTAAVAAATATFSSVISVRARLVATAAAPGVHQVIAEQNRGQQLLRMLDHPRDPRRARRFRVHEMA